MIEITIIGLCLVVITILLVRLQRLSKNTDVLHHQHGVSKEKLDSSMQNSFSGKVVGMNEEDGNVKLNVNVDEQLQVMITHKALENLQLSIGSNVWISFKSSSVVIF